MKKTLENIKNRPDDHKKRIVYVAAGIGAGVVVIFYILLRLFLADAQPRLDQPSDSSSQASTVIDSFLNVVESQIDSVSRKPSLLSESVPVDIQDSQDVFLGQEKEGSVVEDSVYVSDSELLIPEAEEDLLQNNINNEE